MGDLGLKDNGVLQSQQRSCRGCPEEGDQKSRCMEAWIGREG